MSDYGDNKEEGEKEPFKAPPSEAFLNYYMYHNYSPHGTRNMAYDYSNLASRNKWPVKNPCGTIQFEDPEKPRYIFWSPLTARYECSYTNNV